VSVETFDFQAYIAEHKDPEARQRSVAVGDYAFRLDVKWLRTLQALAPMRVLLGATARLWRGWGRKEVLEDAVRATEREATRVYNLARDAARDLHMAPVAIYVTPHLKDVPAVALGDEEETFVAVHTEAVRALDDASLSFLLGQQLARVHNGHVRYVTAQFYADEIAGMVVRWAIKPSLISLNKWSQHATITVDRGGLLACRSLDAATRQIVRQSLADKRMHEDVDLDDVMAELDETDDRGSLLERLFSRSPAVSRRVAALELFAETRYWRDHTGDAEPGGLSLSEVDDRVAVMISAGGTRPAESE